MESKFSATSWGLISPANQTSKQGPSTTPWAGKPLSAHDLKEIKEFCVLLLGPEITLFVKDKSVTNENDACFVMIEVHRQVNNRVEMQNALAQRMQNVFKGRKARIMLVDSQTKLTEELLRFRALSRQI